MLKFLLTIIARPDLAPYVKALLCVGPHTYKGEKPTLIADDARSRIKAELSKAGVKEDMRDSWCEKLCDLAKDGAWEATIALLMLLLPNLSTLGMPRYHETGIGREPTFIPLVFARAVELQTSNTPSPYAMKNLRNTDIGLMSLFDFVPSMSRTMAFFQLRSIKNVTSRYNFANHAENIEGIPEVLPNVTHLSLKEYNIAPLIFAKLLKPFCNLINLTYTSRSGSDPSFSFSPREIRKGIMHLEQSLQELTIINQHEEVDASEESVTEHEMEEDEDRSLGSLLGFQKLRRLEATIRTLVGGRRANSPSLSTVLEDFDMDYYLQQSSLFAERLPDALEELVLRSCPTHVYLVVAALFDRRRRGALKKIKEITLIFRNRFSRKKIEEKLSD
jgi:hypothetical protein